MGHANCSCKGVSKECLVVLGAGDPSEPSAPGPVASAAPAPAQPSTSLSPRSEALRSGSKPGRSSQFGLAERPPPLPLSDNDEGDTNSVMSQASGSQVTAPPAPSSKSRSPSKALNGNSIPVAVRQKPQELGTPILQSPRGEPPQRSVPEPLSLSAAAGPDNGKKTMPTNFGEEPRPKPGSPPGLAQPDLSKTLDSDTIKPVTPDMAMRLLAYKERQERRGKKKQGMAGQAASSFLSQVPEVEKDIPIRFMFEVCGAKHERLVHATCDSESALALSNGRNGLGGEDTPKKEESDRQLLATIYRTGSGGFMPHVCLCEVPWTAADTEGKKRSSSKVRLAKLSFRELPPGKLTVACKSQSDAESSCTVFMVHIDEGPPMKDVFKEMEKVVVELMESVPPTRRPIPAVFLIASARERSEKAEAAWKKTLSAYEAEVGKLLRFGPMCLDDGDAVHQAFASLATARIHAQERGFTSKELWRSFNLASKGVNPWPLVDLPARPLRAGSTKSLGSYGSIG